MRTLAEASSIGSASTAVAASSLSFGARTSRQRPGHDVLDDRLAAPRSFSPSLGHRARAARAASPSGSWRSGASPSAPARGRRSATPSGTPGRRRRAPASCGSPASRGSRRRRRGGRAAWGPRTAARARRRSRGGRSAPRRGSRRSPRARSCPRSRLRRRRTRSEGAAAGALRSPAAAGSSSWVGSCVIVAPEFVIVQNYDCHGTIHGSARGRRRARRARSSWPSATGRSAPGERLPSVRALAAEAGLSPSTVAAGAGRAAPPRAGRHRRAPRHPRGDARARRRGAALMPVPAGARDLSRGNPDPALLPDLGAALRALRAARPACTASRRCSPELARAGPRAARRRSRGRAAVRGQRRARRDRAACCSPTCARATGWPSRTPATPPCMTCCAPTACACEPVARRRARDAPRGARGGAARGAAAVVITPRAQNPTGARCSTRGARAGAAPPCSPRHPGVLAIEDDHFGLLGEGGPHSALAGLRALGRRRARSPRRSDPTCAWRCSRRRAHDRARAAPPAVRARVGQPHPAEPRRGAVGRAAACSASWRSAREHLRARAASGCSSASRARGVRGPRGLGPERVDPGARGGRGASRALLARGWVLAPGAPLPAAGQPAGGARHDRHAARPTRPSAWRAIWPTCSPPAPSPQRVADRRPMPRAPDRRRLARARAAPTRCSCACSSSGAYADEALQRRGRRAGRARPGAGDAPGLRRDPAPGDARPRHRASSPNAPAGAPRPAAARRRCGWGCTSCSTSQGPPDYATVAEAVELAKHGRPRRPRPRQRGPAARRPRGTREPARRAHRRDARAGGAEALPPASGSRACGGRSSGPEQARALMAADNEPAELAVRANTLVGRRRRARRAAAGARPSRRAASPRRSCSRSPSTCTPRRCGRRGRVIAQSRAAMLVVARAGARRPASACSTCARRPGGKSTHLAALMGGRGEVVAVERDRRRAGALARTAAAACAPATSASRSPTRPSRAAKSPFDRVLVDPPCSGLGHAAGAPRPALADRGGLARGAGRASSARSSPPGPAPSVREECLSTLRARSLRMRTSA